MYQLNQYATVGGQQPVIYPTSPDPQTFVHQQPRPNIGEKHKKVYKFLGVAEIFLGISSIFFAITNIILVNVTDGMYGDFSSYIAAGIWCGGMLLACGILGRISAKKPRHCPIVSAMVLTIITSPLCAAMVMIEASAAGNRRYCYYYGYIDSHSNTLSPCYRVRAALTAFHGILAAIAFASLITAIVHSAYCCASVCCGLKRYPETNYNVVYTASGANQQQAVQIGTQYQHAAMQYSTPVAMQVQPTMQLSPSAPVAGPSLVVDLPPSYSQCLQQPDQMKSPL